MSQGTPWPQTDAYRELLEAASACGLTLDPEVKTEGEWAFPTEAVKLAFHREWSRRMRARCGFSEEQPAFSRVEVERKAADRAPRGDRRDAILAVLPTDPAFAIGIKALTRRLGHGDALQSTIRSTVKKLVERGLVARAHESAIGVRRGAVRDADRQAFYRVAA